MRPAQSFLLALLTALTAASLLRAESWTELRLSSGYADVSFPHFMASAGLRVFPSIHLEPGDVSFYFEPEYPFLRGNASDVHNGFGVRLGLSIAHDVDSPTFGFYADAGLFALGSDGLLCFSGGITVGLTRRISIAPDLFIGL